MASAIYATIVTYDAVRDVVEKRTFDQRYTQRHTHKITISSRKCFMLWPVNIHPTACAQYNNGVVYRFLSIPRHPFLCVDDFLGNMDVYAVSQEA